MRLLKARLYLHWKYAWLKVTVLSAAVDEIAGSVTLRWRISALPQIKVLKFWRFLPTKFRESAKDDAE